jgi:sortase (surface protein transpeptidase)
MAAALGAALFGTTVPWQVGLATTVLAGVLLWSVTGRLRLRPETRAASTALFASGALLADAGTDGVDGRATLLLTVAALGASAGSRHRQRERVAAVACLAAVVVAPVLVVGLFVLLGAMALTRDIGARLPATARRAGGWASIAAGAGVAALLGALAPVVLAPEPAAVPAPLVAALVAGAVLVGGLLWGRQPWVRPPVATVVALAACLALPGFGPAAVLPVTAGVAVLGAVLVEEYRGLFARPVLVAATMGVVVVTGGLLPLLVSAPAAPPAVRPAAERLPPPAGAAENAVPGVRPVSISIPALSMSGPLGELSQADNGELLAPDDPGLAGWYTAGVVPGDVGPAVIGGHVDSRRGPGVFVALRSLRRGDVVEIERSDGRTVAFAVTRVQEVAKAQFPTAAVYAATPQPELRLITCGGRFDRGARSYTGNVVVEAVVVERTEATPARTG